MTAATSAAPVRDEQLRVRGLRIHAQICGEGEPLSAVSHLPARTKALGTKVTIWSSFGPWSLKSRGATLTWEETEFHSGNFNVERT